MSTGKITDEELKSISNYFTREIQYTAEIGRNAMEKLLLQERMNELEEKTKNIEKDYINANKEQHKFLQNLLKKYNAKEINQSTGEYIK